MPVRQDESSRPAESSNRRHYIQGLRAVAVLTVILFHAKLPVPGGFVGVDMFFVVSGFVITAMLRREWLQEQRIRLGRFYLRRFLRLSPALALVAAVTVVASALLFSPEGSRNTSATATAALLFVANWNIALTTGGYFGLSAETNPLLNTWSLSVEEQFYLFFPALLLTGWAASRRSKSLRHAPLLAIGLVGTLSLSAVLFYPRDGGGALYSLLFDFYGPLGRVWEFAIGAALALVSTQIDGSSKKLAAPLSLLGAATLLLSFFLIDAKVRFPGPWTLAPALGTGLLLLSAGHAGTLVNRFLSLPPLVAVGDWSYSLYLWHWPFIVFAGLLWPGNRGLLLVAAIASMLPAIASYYWLEQPIRRMSKSSAPKTALAASITGTSLFIAVLLSFLPNSYWLPRVVLAHSKTEYRGEVEWKDHDYRFGGFHPCASPALRKMVEEASDYDPRCQQSKPGPEIDVALIGDSHAEHLFIGISEALPDSNVMYFCTDEFPALSNPRYRAAIEAVNDSPGIERVIVTAFWAGRRFERAELTELLRSLAAHGKQVMVTDGLPSFPFSPSPCKYHSSSVCSIEADDFWRRHEKYAGELRAVAADVSGATLLETAGYLCDEENCSMTRGDAILYADRSHLNVLGSRYVGKRLIEEHPSLFVD